jgi:VWFA-related protein
MKYRVAAFLVLVGLLSGVAAAQTNSRGKTTDSRPRRVEPESKTSGPKTNVAVGEEVSAGDVIRISTDLVTVPVSVLDRDGRFVPGLRSKDFRVFEDGLEQKISYFEPTESPFTVALVLDTSASTRFHLSEIKEAAIAFAKQLRPQDRVLVMTFSDRLLVLTEATNDQEIISSVIETNVVTGRSTRLYDAVDFVVNERLNKLKGRKAIVLFTDGVDTASHRATYESTLREAEELDALVYPIEYDTSSYIRGVQGSGTLTIVTGSNWPFPGSTSSRVIYGRPTPGTTAADYKRGDEYLQALAYRSGGRLYKTNDSTQLAQAFSSIAEELRRQYRLGYYPQSGIDPGEARREIKVSVARPNVAVRARNSYKRRTSTTSPVQ